VRVVLDTNVVVSALVYGGNPRQILQAAIAGTIDVPVSESLIQELQEVLRRPQFGLSAQYVRNAIAELTTIAQWETPDQHHHVVEEDPADDLVLDCAVAAEADYLVTGDKHLLRLGRLGRVEIVTLQDFVGILGKL
jgi:putative PIN family toxin of toxin-antitoxin system